jgi:hypothetical protein
MLSEAKTGKPVATESRSLASSWLDSGRPNTTRRTRAIAFAVGVRGREAASRAISERAPVYWK